MQRLIFLSLVGVTSALGACGSSVMSRAVVTNAANQQCYFGQAEPMVSPDPPKRPFAAIGTVEVRADDSTAIADLLNELAKRGGELCADVVIPGAVAGGAARAPSRAGAYGPFYVASEDGTVVLRGQGVRYTK